MLTRIAGAAIVIASLVLNEWFCEAYLFPLHSAAFQVEEPLRIHLRLELLHLFQILGVALGLALLFHNWTARLAKRFAKSRFGSLFVSKINAGSALALVPLAAAETIYWLVSCWCDQIPFWLPVALFSWIGGLAISLVLFLLATVVLTKLLQFRYMPLVSALVWAIAISTDTLLFWYGNTRFEAKYVGMATSDSLPGFVSAGAVFFVLTMLVLCLASGLLLIRPAASMTWASCSRMAALLAVLYVADIPYRAFSINEMFVDARIPSAPGELCNHYLQLKYIGRDSVLNACLELALPPNLGEVSDLRPFETTISHYDLPLGQQNYKPLQTKPFRRVVVVFCESLSSFFLKSCNTKLPGTATPFLDSVGDGNLLMRNHRTSSQPTTQGLAVTFCSHPNPELVIFSGFAQSFITALRDHGWHTVFFSSATKYFDNKARNCAKAGIQEFFGAEALSENPQDAKYRLNWGMCDRILYRRAKEYLAEHRDEQIFMVIEGADTHVPDGRTNYGDLKYPPTPEWIEGQKLSGFLRSVFRMDHDLKTFVEDLKKEKLLDDDTLLIVTADHCFPACPILESLPGTNNSAFARIPLFMISTRALPPVDRNRPTSQLDVGPSLLHLQEIPVPQGSWGRSMFNPRSIAATFVGIFRHAVSVESKRVNENFDLYRPETRPQKELSVLLRVYLKDADEKKAGK